MYDIALKKLSRLVADAASIFADAPNWMSLENAHHFLKLAIASYGWLYVVYQHACTGCFRLARGMICCACFRRKRDNVLDDNCCFCSMAGVKYLSKLSEDDILFASFRNHLCEVSMIISIESQKYQMSQNSFRSNQT